jgi:hypothetical protein
VVYSDGTIIYAASIAERKYWGIRYSYRSVKLLPTMVRKLLTNWPEVPKDRERKWVHLDDNAHGATAIYFRPMVKTARMVAVEGLDCEWPADDAGSRLKGAGLPEGMLSSHRHLCDLEYLGAQVWEPRIVVVHLWQHIGAAPNAFRWPNGWPSLESSASTRVFRGYRILLSGDHIQELQQLIGNQDGPRFARVNEKDWLINYREVFPGESVWRNELSGRN